MGMAPKLVSLLSGLIGEVDPTSSLALGLLFIFILSPEPSKFRPSRTCWHLFDDMPGSWGTSTDGSAHCRWSGVNDIPVDHGNDSSLSPPSPTFVTSPSELA